MRWSGDPDPSSQILAREKGTDTIIGASVQRGANAERIGGSCCCKLHAAPHQERRSSAAQGSNAYQFWLVVIILDFRHRGPAPRKLSLACLYWPTGPAYRFLKKSDEGIVERRTLEAWNIGSGRVCSNKNYCTETIRSGVGCESCDYGLCKKSSFSVSGVILS